MPPDRSDIGRRGSRTCQAVGMTGLATPAGAAPPQLAQVNVSVAKARLDDPTMRGFVYAFDRVARLAAVAPGFV